MTQAAEKTITRESARAEIEATRVEFHELLLSLSDADFKMKSGNGAWSNGQLLWHCAWGVSYIPDGVRRCRSGSDLKIPAGLFNLLNPWITRWGSRGITKESIGKKYDEANTAALKVLETVKDDEWSLGCKQAGNPITIESEFRMPAVHFAEHKADILKALGRTG